MFSRLVQIALLALGLAIGDHADAAPLAYGTYYDETAGLNCSGSTACRLNFSQLPADKLVMVQKIHCRLQSSQPVTSGTFEIASSLGGGPASSRILPITMPPPPTAIAGTFHTSFREDTHFLIGQGRFPFVVLFTAASSTFVGLCTMIGELVTPL
jgi:hypothetical protein